MSVSTSSIEQTAINTIRTLSMDAVQKANSGHPGTPMALAPAAYVLWNSKLRYDPATPHWPGRDRFVLSCGHASMLLYSMLHLSGVKKADGAEELSITLDDIENFRQLGSPCAGHPEYDDAAGIETTTGPLGQGIGNSVGMAAAANWLAARFNRPGFDLFGFNVYAFCSHGDFMDGVGCEAASLAGHLKLSNLCWIYDDNKITIEGHTDLAFSENVARRFEGLGWNAIEVDDANDLKAIEKAYDDFAACDDRPTIIVLRSIIAWGAPNKANTHGAHGAPLGEDEVAATKEVSGWDKDAHFYVPDEVREHLAAGIGARGGQLCDEWTIQFDAYESEHPEAAAHWKLLQDRELPDGWDADIPTFDADQKGTATRGSGGKVLNSIAQHVPWLLGGSADLAPSTKTLLGFEEASGDFEAGGYGGRNFHFGVREHAMAAACNGLSLCGLRPYGATFFVFSDYLRPSMRLSSIMHQPVLYIFTHDSIGVGEDGPTHQPIEHLAACRAIPRLVVMRPGDANEVAECYRAAMQINNRPIAMVLTRQNVPTLDRTKYAPASGAARGGYILGDSDGTPEVILMATGSELSVAVAAYEELTAAGTKARVVSLPSFELFDEQYADYRESVLPSAVTARVAVEASIRQCWDKYLGPHGEFVGMSDFGASAPAGKLMEHFGITSAAVVEKAKSVLG